MSNTEQQYLSVSQVSKSFGRVNVLNNVDLSCDKGELICLLGPSGCGKTTLLRIIAGLERQNSGRLIQDGQDISHLKTEKRDFGIVFQSYALFPNLTVEQNVAYGLRKQPKSQVIERVQTLLSTVDLSEHSKKYPAQLSGGQQQRVALARALAMSPGLLLLDEPLSALDAKVRIHLRQEIKSIQRRLGITTIMVTHDQDEAMSMADRVVVMNRGVIEQVGTPSQVYRRPSTPFVASFIGVMNFLPATVKGAQHVDCFGVEYPCQLPNSAELGERVVLAVRPEQFLVSEGHHEQGLPARVEKIEFLGAFTRLYVTLANDQFDDTLLIDVTNETQGVEQYQPGRLMTLSLASPDIMIYDHAENTVGI